jgi:DMSO/TMAO reductase YedYZ molybdopterin-dependent catalytic subunit
MKQIQTDRKLTDKEIKRLSRRSFIWGGVAIASGVTGLVGFNKNAPREKNTDGTDNESGTKEFFRSVLQTNERIFSAGFSDTHLAPTFAPELAVTPRNNYHGETPETDLEAWLLDVLGQKLTLADLKKLPEITQTSELKCVEGWSVIVTWTGCRFRDFAKIYAPPSGTQYVSMLSEPADVDEEMHYYVGLDLASCLHPQTLLAWGMNGEALDAAHGAPLRLVMPHKYGIKNIKLITKIEYATERPADYWADRGYDWYAGL